MSWRRDLSSVLFSLLEVISSLYKDFFSSLEFIPVLKDSRLGGRISNYGYHYEKKIYNG